jgi:hypothetical protein
MSLPAWAGAVLVPALAYFPGAAVVAWARPRAPSVARIATALALSPGLAGVATAGLASLGLGFAASGLIVLAVAVSAWAAAPRGRASSPPPGEPGSPSHAESSRAGVAWALSLAALVAAYPLLSEWYRIFSDAWAHQPIVRSMFEGGLPPRDPWFAGLRLGYAWTYHAFVATLVALSGLDAFTLMACFSVVSVAALAACVAHLAHRVHGAGAGWTVAFVSFGLNALFPLFLPLLVARAVVGEVRGFEELARTFALWPLDGDQAGGFLRSLGGQDFFLNKFLTATPLGLALAATAAWAASFRRWLESTLPESVGAGTGARRGARGELLLGATLALGAGSLHPVVGAHLAVTAGGVAAISAVARGPVPGATASAWAWCAASAVGVVPAAWHLLGRPAGGGPGGLPLDVSLEKLLGLGSCLALGLWFGARPALRAWSRGGADRLFVAWAAASLGLALVIRLPGPETFFTVDKFSYLAWIPLALLAAPAASAALASRGQAARWALALALFVPVNGLALVSRAFDRQASLRQSWSLADHVWLRQHLPREAVLVTPPGDIDTGVFLGADQYFGLDVDAQLRGYARDEMGARRRLVERLFGEGVLGEGDAERLAALGRPVYAVWADRRDARLRDTPGAFARPDSAGGERPAWGTRFPVVHAGERYFVVALTPGAEREIAPASPPPRGPSP